RFLGGAELSGGEWQKVALARAYLKDAPLIVLDEPTAALDPRSEDQMYKNFVSVAEGKVAVIISHRLSTVRVADRIVVLKSGRILEQGSHADLVARSGHYAELFTLQAAGYK